MALPFLAQLLISLALQVVAYIIMPRPKVSRPDAFKEMDNPTADAGRPVPVIFGDIEIRQTNVLWFGDKATVTYAID